MSKKLLMLAQLVQAVVAVEQRLERWTSAVPDVLFRTVRRARHWASQMAITRHVEQPPPSSSKQPGARVVVRLMHIRCQYPSACTYGIRFMHSPARVLHYTQICSVCNAT